MKQLEVQIMGQSYLLGCPEQGDVRMLDAVSRVDMAMCKIRDAGKVRARDRIAVLAALNLAFNMPEPPATAPDRPLPTPLACARELLQHARLTALLQRLDAVLDSDGKPL
ncbi:MAG: cell division protein ZapA [Polaromonas sp.]|nr:MAG: cell division protein ZapA [Polaromonas sp.]